MLLTGQQTKKSVDYRLSTIDDKKYVCYLGEKAEANSACDVVQRYNTEEYDGCMIRCCYSCSLVRS